MRRALAVKAMDNYLLLVKFDNGEQKVYNCFPLLQNKLFSELEKIEFFKTVHIDEMGVVCWSNSTDINPYDLYENSESLTDFSFSNEQKGLSEVTGMDTEIYLEALESILSKRYPVNRYHIGGYQEASVCLQSTKNGWVVYTGEKGNRYAEVQCDTILKACLEVIRKMTHHVEDISAMENELIRLLSKEKSA